MANRTEFTDDMSDKLQEYWATDEEFCWDAAAEYIAQKEEKDLIGIYNRVFEN